MYFENFDLKTIMTPVKPDVFEKLLQEAHYDPQEINFLINGFRNGFDIGFRGSIQGIQRYAPNLPFRVGNEIVLWNKIMKEVSLKRYAGPYLKVPFDEFIQSPVGLVPKGRTD